MAGSFFACTVVIRTEIYSLLTAPLFWLCYTAKGNKRKGVQRSVLDINQTQRHCCPYPRQIHMFQTKYRIESQWAFCVTNGKPLIYEKRRKLWIKCYSHTCFSNVRRYVSRSCFCHGKFIWHWYSCYLQRCCGCRWGQHPDGEQLRRLLQGKPRWRKQVKEEWRSMIVLDGWAAFFLSNIKRNAKNTERIVTISCGTPIKGTTWILEKLLKKTKAFCQYFGNRK